MRLLLDTQLLLRAVAIPDQLDGATRTTLEDPENDVLFSAASIWEIAIKSRLGRPDFAFRPQEILLAAQEIGFVELPVRARATTLVADLPLHHRDPFDRLLVAQAISEPVRLYTTDSVLPSYSELVTLVA